MTVKSSRSAQTYGSAIAQKPHAMESAASSSSSRPRWRCALKRNAPMKAVVIAIQVGAGSCQR